MCRIISVGNVAEKEGGAVTAPDALNGMDLPSSFGPIDVSLVKWLLQIEESNRSGLILACAPNRLLAPPAGTLCQCVLVCEQFGAL